MLNFTSIFMSFPSKQKSTKQKQNSFCDQWKSTDRFSAASISICICIVIRDYRCHRPVVWKKNQLHYNVLPKLQQPEKSKLLAKVASSTFHRANSITTFIIPYYTILYYTIPYYPSRHTILCLTIHHVIISMFRTQPNNQKTLFLKEQIDHSLDATVNHYNFN